MARRRVSTISIIAMICSAGIARALRCPRMGVSRRYIGKIDRIDSPLSRKLSEESFFKRTQSRLFQSEFRRETQDSLPQNTDAISVQQAYTLSLKRLQQQGVSEPEWSVAHLLSSAMDLPWSNGFSQLQRAVETGTDKQLSEQLLTLSQWERYQSMLERRLTDEPLQYILGKWDFLDYEQLVIRSPLLCPRPETEELVVLVRKDVQNQQGNDGDNHHNQQVNILDIGCGTGVIGIALADTIPSSKVCAIDIEPVAVATSLENAKLILGPSWEERYSAVKCSADNYSTADGGNNGCFDIIVSNPPYIPRKDMKTLSPDVVQYESDQALCGGEDGMDVIRTIIHKWAREWGKRPTSTCWMEVDPSHPALLQSWLDQDEQRRDLGVFLEATHQDLSGRDRFVKLAFRQSEDS